MSFKGKTVFITGASRGIGKAIGLRLAKEGANVVVAAKSVEENPKLGGTIFSAANEMEEAGGKGLAIQLDIRFEDQVQLAVEKTVFNDESMYSIFTQRKQSAYTYTVAACYVTIKMAGRSCCVYHQQIQYEFVDTGLGF